MPATTPRQFRLTDERTAKLDELAARWSGKVRKATRTDVINALIDQAWKNELHETDTRTRRRPDR